MPQSFEQFATLNSCARFWKKDFVGEKVFRVIPESCTESAQLGLAFIIQKTELTGALLFFWLKAVRSRLEPIPTI